ncbi:hypothetical protein PCE1_003199 [Barthelona sp. PCE]
MGLKTEIMLEIALYVLASLLAVVGIILLAFCCKNRVGKRQRRGMPFPRLPVQATAKVGTPMGLHDVNVVAMGREP